MVDLWAPDPTWERLRGGPSSDGVWRARRDGRSWVVKRLARPEDAVPQDHPGWWRRQAEAVTSSFADGPGLRTPPGALVEDDKGGLVVWVPELVGEPPTGLQVARCLGSYAAAAYDAPAWATRDLLRTRLRLAEERGGWRTLARTTIADAADLLWRRREHWLDRLDALPQGRVHGDVVPSNVLVAQGEDVVATDWQCLGVGPLGSDLGYWSLSAREELPALLEAFAVGARRVRGDVDLEAAALAARVTATYSVLGRAEWALAQAAAGEGALAGKFRHPSVAPYLRAVQRQLPQIESLLG